MIDLTTIKKMFINIKYMRYFIIVMDRNCNNSLPIKEIDLNNLFLQHFYL